MGRTKLLQACTSAVVKERFYEALIWNTGSGLVRSVVMISSSGLK